MWGRILIFSCVLPWPSALAAPWVQDDGGLYARISLVDEEVQGLQGYRTDAYLEYGLTDRWTASFKLEQVDYQEAPDFDSEGWRATLRRSLYKSESIKVSLELGVLQGSAIGGRNGCDELGGEIRTGVAWSGELRKQSAFAFGEVASRMHGDCERQRLEAGLGLQLSESIWSVSQVWIERGAREAASDKFQSEWVWRTDAADLSIGYRRELGDAFQEESVFAAIARQF